MAHVKDDPSKLAKPLKAPHSASYKQGAKTEVTTGTVSKKSIFNGDRAFDPLKELVLLERKGKQGKRKEQRIDPYMVRQAKLLAAKQA